MAPPDTIVRSFEIKKVSVLKQNNTFIAVQINVPKTEVNVGINNNDNRNAIYYNISKNNCKNDTYKDRKCKTFIPTTTTLTMVLHVFHKNSLKPSAKMN